MQKPDLQMEINLRTKGWGISVHSDRLVLTAIRNRFKQIRLAATAELENLSQKSDDEVREFIDDFIDEHRLKRGEAFLGLPRRQVQLQLVEFPLEAAESLDEVLSYQIENLFPGNYDQFDFFHQILGRYDQLIVLVIAIRKEDMGRIFAEIRRWNLGLAGVALEACAWLNAMARLKGDQFLNQKYALFHFDQDSLELVIIRDGRLVLDEWIEYRDDHLEDDITAGLERAFSSGRVDPNELDLFLLSGAAPDRALDFLRDQVGIQFNTLEDSMGKSIPPSSIYGTGLAITAVYDKVPLQLNLLPQNLRKRHRHLPLLIASFVVFVFMAYFFYGEFRDFKKIKRELAFAKTQSQRLQERVEELSAVQLDFFTKEEQVKTFYKFRHSDGVALKLLYEITQALPDHTYLTSFSVRSGDQLTIQGESEEPFAVRSKLQSLPFLSDVDTKNAITPGRDPSKKKFTFGARIVLEALK